MTVHRCPCGNITLQSGEPNGRRTDESEAGRKAPASSSAGVNTANVVSVFPALTRKNSTGVVTCLVCNTATYKLVDGKPAEALVDGTDDRSNESRALSAALGLVVPSPSSSSADPPRTRRFPSPPAPTPSYPESITLLPPLREPFFLPSPFSPSHPAFHAISLQVDAHLRAERQRLATEIDSLLAQKRDELEAVEDKARADVEQIWAAYEDGEADREDAELANGGQRDPVVQGTATPKKTTERFPLEMMTSSVSSLAPQGATAVAGSYKSGFVLPSPSTASSRPATSVTVPRSTNPSSSTPLSPLSALSPSSALSPNAEAGPTSLLSASLSRGAYLLTQPPAYVDTRPPPPPRVYKGGFSTTPPPAPPPTDRDLAVSMVASTWLEPDNLIFSSAKYPPKPRPETVKEEQRPAVGVLGRGAESESFKDRQEQMSAQPSAKTPPSAAGSNGGGEQEIAFLEESATRTDGDTDRAGENQASVAKGKGKAPKSPNRKVTFVEPMTDDTAVRDGEDDEGELMFDGHHEEVFDFEEPEVPSSSPSPSPVAEKSSSPSPLNRRLSSPSRNAVPSSSRRLSSPTPLLPEPEPVDKRAARAPVKQEPMYTLDGRSIRPVEPSKSSSRCPSMGDRRTPAERELRDGEGNRVLVSMKKLTGADLPSHRSAWKDKTRAWQIYGRHRERDRTESGSSDDVPPETHYGQSLPVNIIQPPSRPGTTSTLGSALPSLERKTSLSDRRMLVPPLRTRTSHTARTSSSSSTTNSASRTSPSDLVRETSAGSETRSRRPGNRRNSSQTSFGPPGPAMDPGPALDDVEDDGETTEPTTEEDRFRRTVRKKFTVGSSGEDTSGGEFVPPHERARRMKESTIDLGWASAPVAEAEDASRRG